MSKQSSWHFKIFLGVYIYIYFFQSSFSCSFGFQIYLFLEIFYSFKIVPHLIYKDKHTQLTPSEVAKCHWPLTVKQHVKLFLGNEGRNEFHLLKQLKSMSSASHQRLLACCRLQALTCLQASFSEVWCSQQYTGRSCPMTAFHRSFPGSVPEFLSYVSRMERHV